jgi:two-component system sensor histidine kinase/response regulator
MQDKIAWLAETGGNRPMHQAKAQLDPGERVLGREAGERQSIGDQAPRPAATTDRRTSGNILIVDDVPANLRLLLNILAAEGHQVRAVPNGAHALAAAFSSPPDLILLDIVMPEMDGYEVCRRLKADARTRDIPILFMSALSDTHAKLRAFAAGGVDYVTKPFQGAEILARVQTHLTMRSLYQKLEETNAELSGRLQELEMRNKELDAFAATVAHDIKSPLSIIVGYTQFLALDYEDLSKQERTSALKTLEQKAADLARVVDALLLLSRLRREEVSVKPLSMAPLVQNALIRLAPIVDESGAEIVLPASWPEACGYAPWIEEVWINYLSNACRYGGAPPSIDLGGECLSNGQVRFWVRDRGRGIAPQDQPNLFEAFTRLNSRHEESHGLGLSIVQRIVHRLGGQVGVESDGVDGHGSLFFFTLPQAPCAVEGDRPGDPDPESLSWSADVSSDLSR